MVTEHVFLILILYFQMMRGKEKRTAGTNVRSWDFAKFGA